MCSGTTKRMFYEMNILGDVLKVTALKIVCFEHVPDIKDTIC